MTINWSKNKGKISLSFKKTLVKKISYLLGIKNLKISNNLTPFWMISTPIQSTKGKINTQFRDPNRKVPQTQERKNIIKTIIVLSRLQKQIILNRKPIHTIKINYKTEVPHKKLNSFHHFKQIKCLKIKFIILTFIIIIL